ncbi:MAG: hypothetical protein ACREBD_04210 [Blastocatellia bacterium]
MPDSDPPTKESQASEVVKALADLVLKDEELRKSLGRGATYAILAATAVAAIKLTIGLPVISFEAIPLIAFPAFVLITAVEGWIRSGRPPTVFYICPEEDRFIRIKRSSHPKYRQMRSCPDCGCELIRRCQQGKHFIVSPDPDNPDTPPKLDGFCLFCRPSLPKTSRAYLPATDKPANRD